MVNRFKPGDRVRLRLRPLKEWRQHMTALAYEPNTPHAPYTEHVPNTVVEALLPDVDGGILLEKRMAGFRYWNEADLILIPRKGK